MNTYHTSPVSMVSGILTLLLICTGPAFAACSSYIIPTKVTVRAETMVEVMGTLQSSDCTCPSNNSALLVSSATMAGRWTGLLLTAKATSAVVRVYSTGACTGNWWVAGGVSGSALTIE